MLGVIAALNKYGAEALAQLQPAGAVQISAGRAMSVGGALRWAALSRQLFALCQEAQGLRCVQHCGRVAAWHTVIIGGAFMALWRALRYDGGADPVGRCRKIVVLILARGRPNRERLFRGLALTNLSNLKSSKRALTTAIAGIIGTVLAVVGI